MKEITVAQVLQNNPENYVFIDVRKKAEHFGEHIKNSTWISKKELVNNENSRDLARNLSNQKTAIVYCQTGKRGAKVCTLLEQHGIETHNLTGGIEAWKEAKQEIISTRMPIIRQVMIIAGSITLLGVILGLIINPLLSLIAGFIGLGLTISGTTGWCGMAKLLEHAPWNK